MGRHNTKKKGTDPGETAEAEAAGRCVVHKKKKATWPGKLPVFCLQRCGANYGLAAVTAALFPVISQVSDVEVAEIEQATSDAFDAAEAAASVALSDTEALPNLEISQDEDVPCVRCGNAPATPDAAPLCGKCDVEVESLIPHEGGN